MKKRDVKKRAREPENTHEPVQQERDRAIEREDVAAVQTLLQKAQEEAKENYDRLLRVSADFENYKKRTAKEKADLIRYGNAELIKELLVVLDNLERALEHDDGAAEQKGVLEGIELTLMQLLQILQKFGLSPISAVGEPFDPAMHEAVMAQPTDEYEAGHVASELQKGYMLNDRLLRPVKVVVASAQGNAGEKTGDSEEAEQEKEER